eukprot:1869516-Amphidinium_carterae.2
MCRVNPMLAGGCYKHSFYGITSYQCMEVCAGLMCVFNRAREVVCGYDMLDALHIGSDRTKATPSLACANKCVFCWRHCPANASACNPRIEILKGKLADYERNSVAILPFTTCSSKSLD